MRQRRPSQQPIARGELEPGRPDREHPAERLVGMGDPLRAPGTAGGKEDHRRCRRRRRRRRRRGLPLHQLAESPGRSGRAAVADGAPWQLRGELACGQILLPLGVRNQGTGSADRQGMIDLRRHVAVIEGRRDQPRLETGQVVNDERRTIRHQRSDPIARAQPQTEQTGSQPIAEVIERAPRPARIRRDQREPIRIGIQTGAKQTARDDRPRQRPSGIPSHAATPGARSTPKRCRSG